MGVQPLTTHQQLERLIELGIKSSPRNIQKDEEALETIGYYKLKEFAMPFNINSNRQDGENLNFNGVSMKQLVSRYFQDKNLRVNVLHSIESIEVTLQNQVAYLLGRKYKAFGYLNFANWCNREKFKRFDVEKEQVYFKQKLLKKVKKSQLPDMQYGHNLNDDGFPTVWLMIDALTFGDTVNLLKYMSKTNLKAISESFDCTPSELLSWLECLNLVRNVCCHNSDLLDIKFKTKPMVPANYAENLYHVKTGHYTDKIAIAIFIIQQLMLSVNSNYDFGAIEQALYNIIGQSDEAAHTLGFADGKSILALHVSPGHKRRTKRKH